MVQSSGMVLDCRDMDEGSWVHHERTFATGMRTRDMTVEENFDYDETDLSLRHPVRAPDCLTSECLKLGSDPPRAGQEPKGKRRQSHGRDRQQRAVRESMHRTLLLGLVGLLSALLLTPGADAKFFSEVVASYDNWVFLDKFVFDSSGKGKVAWVIKVNGNDPLYETGNAHATILQTTNVQSSVTPNRRTSWLPPVCNRKYSFFSRICVNVQFCCTAGAPVCIIAASTIFVHTL